MRPYERMKATCGSVLTFSDILIDVVGLVDKSEVAPDPRMGSLAVTMFFVIDEDYKSLDIVLR